jgi:trans-2,3-dihydro-3-hydroxyanthranilate isomerase
MSTLRFWIVDVFAEEKYAGNQLAVIAGASDLSPTVMQKIARETNFSETTFIISEPEADSVRVRIFTPAAELPFAGHPTLGTAWVIRKQLARGQRDWLTLDLPVGPVRVDLIAEPDGRDLVWMQPPPPKLGPVHPASAVAPLVGLSPDEIDARFPVQTASVGIAFTMIPLRALASVRHARFNAAAAEQLSAPAWPMQFFLFAPETYDPQHHFNARMFASDYGVQEDPATGSANTCLGSYLAQHRYLGDVPIDVCVEQGYEVGRPSLLRVRASRGPTGVDVRVGGHVVMVARGELV